MKVKAGAVAAALALAANALPAAAQTPVTDARDTTHAQHQAPFFTRKDALLGLGFAAGNTYALVSTAMFAASNGIELRAVPYKSEPDAMADLLSGRVQMMNGTVTCWGYNYYGQVGNNDRNSVGADVHSPTAVSGLSGVTDIAAGQYHTCAIASGAVSPFGAIDPTDGGDSDRASLSFDWHREQADTSLRLNLYAIYYRLNLFSNFTYFLDDPVHGDQFAQHDRRGVFGGSFEYQANRQVDGRKATYTLGLQTRADTIDLALDHTEARQLLGVVRADTVKEASVGKSFTMKRWHARGRGKSTRIEKPFSRIRIVVREQEEEA